MKTPLPRREFLRQLSACAATAAALGPHLRLGGAESPGGQVHVGVMGLGRGHDHVVALLGLPNVSVTAVCDVDQTRLDRAVQTVTGRQRPAPRAVRDFRRMLEDRDLDAITIAAPNFWHAPATILACAAGKHVYVEKPGSHNPREGEWMVAAARKHRRLVQLGTQRRSWPGIREAMARLQSGVIGQVRFARSYYNNRRPSIGRGRRVPAPAHLDYTLWQGPAPERPYVDNLVHYQWHWRWHWGGGELANNGVHALDLARWGLGVDQPARVTYNGGRYHYVDDQETPDTGVAVFDFGRQGAAWDHSSCNPRPQEPASIATFYGEQGSLAIEGSGYRVYDLDGKETARGTGPGGDPPHFENFVEAIRRGTPLNAEIEEGQKAALLCHLGNIAYRLGRTLHFDAAARKPTGDAAALKLWERDYRPGWKPRL